MPTTASAPHVALIDQMAAEWQSIGRCSLAVGAMEQVAPNDEVFGRLVLGRDGRPAPCPTPFDVLLYMHRARDGPSGRKRPTWSGCSSGKPPIPSSPGCSSRPWSPA